MDDINENKVPEEVRLKIEKLEKNVSDYNCNSIGNAINVASATLVMIAGFWMKSEISTLSFGTLMLLSGGNLAYSFL